MLNKAILKEKLDDFIWWVRTPIRFPKWLGKNKILIAIYEWLYLTKEERNEYINSMTKAKRRVYKIIRIKNLYCFIQDYPTRRMTIAPVWNWTRVKHTFFLRYFPEKEPEAEQPYKNTDTRPFNTDSFSRSSTSPTSTW